MSDQIPRLKEKVYFVRVPETMYKRVEALAKDETRSINLQHQVLLGYALNHYPAKASATEVYKAE